VLNSIFLCWMNENVGVELICFLGCLEKFFVEMGIGNEFKLCFEGIFDC